MYRVFKPLHYTAYVLLYWYVRSVLYGEQKFRRYDALHLIPAFLYLVDSLPFYFMNREAKLRLVYAALEDPNNVFVNAQGWLPMTVHLTLVPLQVFMYCLLTGRLLFQASRQKTVSVYQQNRVVFRWLVLYWAMGLFFFLIWHGLFLFRYNLPGVNIFLAQTIQVALLLMFTGVALMFYPNILYGFQGDMPITNQESSQTTNEPAEASVEDQGGILSEERRKSYLETLESIVERDRPYLNPDLTLTDLAASTGISYLYLSAVINQEYGMNFRDYINRFRVNHIKLLMNQPEFKQYTFEALAKMGGFGSRITFARAFQKFEGCTPSEYLKSMA
jgi:AraC-like DNA-binding protein